ncbi:MAG: NADH:flavin oxidoreductase [Planctomycetes bacterium]|nr:NADH:flavin oxidoreductase [Planctomycetota bacterium]
MDATRQPHQNATLDVVRHALPEAHWPTAEEAASSRLFSSVRLGPIEARTRTWVPAMVPWRATEDGEVTRDVIDWYARFALGKPGVLVVEATGVRDVPSGPLLRIGHDRFVPGLRRLVEAVREASEGQTRLLIQCIDFLTIKRRPTKEKFFGRYLEIRQHHRDATGEFDDTAVRSALAGFDDDRLARVLTRDEWRDYAFGYRETVNDTHLPHVAELPRVLPGLFADAAARAREAGFDGVELHYAHAYTMASFLSRRNVRDDGYGGSRDARIRLPIEVYEAVRARVGHDYCLGCRFLGDEVIEGGSRIVDAAWYGARFAEVGMDFLSVSKGGKFEDAKQPKVGEAAYPYTGPSGHECMPTVRSDARGPFGRNVPLAAEIRRAVRSAGHTTPVVTAGGIGTFDLAEEILRREDADIIASARQTLADPDWFLKAERGCGAEVRRCIFTNYCEGLDQKHKQVTCQLWDRDFEDGEDVPRSHDGKRRLTAPQWTR